LPTDRKNVPSFSGEIPFKWKGRDCSLRLTSEQALAETTAEAGVQTLFLVTSDLTEVTLMALAALAEDLYSRMPQGSREFEHFVAALGLKFTPP
jgi:hypothetical protein